MSIMLKETNKSNISLREYANKLYVDNQYSELQNQSMLNFVSLTGKWDIEDIGEDYSIKIIQRDTGNYILLSFNSFMDKVTFLKSIYTDKPVKQVGVGFGLEMLANGNTLYPHVNYRNLIPKVNLLGLMHKLYSEFLYRLKFEIDTLPKVTDNLIKKLMVIFEK